MAFEVWAIVEIMGHQVIAGKVSEETHFGSPLMRVDVPKSSKREEFTVYYGGGAIYKITPTTEEIVKSFVEKQDPEPVKPYMLALPTLADKVDVDRYGSDDWSGDDYDPEEDDDYNDYSDEDDDFSEDEDDDDDIRLPDPPTPPVAELTAKERAALKAKEITSAPFVVIDTETTDLHDGEVIQFAVIDQDGNVMLNTYIKPEKPITNSEYHGITDEMVKDAPTFKDVFLQIKTILETNKIVVYNLSYDWRMLDADAVRNGFSKFVLKNPDCAMLLYADFYGDWNEYHSNYRWQKLNQAVARFGLKFDGNEHDALADCKATLGVMKKMAEWHDTHAGEKELPF